VFFVVYFFASSLYTEKKYPKESNMLKQLTHISVHQTSKVCAALYFFITALFSIPLGLIALFTDITQGIAFFIFPFIYAILGYIISAVTALFYNWIVKYIGGLEFTLSEVDKVNQRQERNKL
jgi:hypothetical protein